jgi:hypothetical protein
MVSVNLFVSVPCLLQTAGCKGNEFRNRGKFTNILSGSLPEAYFEITAGRFLQIGHYCDLRPWIVLLISYSKYYGK